MATLDRAADFSESLDTDKEKSQEFKRLAEKLDSKLSTAIQQTLTIGPLHTTLLEELTKLKLVPVGSTQDGSKVNTPYDFGDVDIILIATEKVLSERLFRYVKNHPASLWVPGKNEEHAKYFKHITLIEGQYVPVSVLRDIKKEIEKKLKANINRKVQHGAYISEDRINTIEQSKVGYKYESRPTGEDKKDTEEKETEFDKCLFADIVPAFSFKEWPFTAEEWINRKREWPSKEVVNKVIKMGCEIIAKRPLDTGTNVSIPEFIERDSDKSKRVNNASDKQTDENNSDEPTDVNNADKVIRHSDEENEKDGYFCLSFSRCERILVESLSELQVLCWRVLKAYQKVYFETQPQVLKSYHWKTVVFWFVEETQPSFWTEENVMNAVLEMLKRMIDCLQKRFLPLYFVRTQNLITVTSEDAIKKAIEKISIIRRTSIESLQQFFDKPPKPDTPKPEKQPTPPKKPMTPLDVLNETFNDKNARLLSSYGTDVMDLLKGTLSRANNGVSFQTEQLYPPVQNCDEETPDSQQSSTVKQDEQMEINVKTLFDKALHQLSGSSNHEDIRNKYQVNNLIPESEIGLESVLQLAGESVKMLAGGERSAADPEFGRTLVRLMKQNQIPEASAPCDTKSPLDFGKMTANMNISIDEFNKKEEKEKKDKCNTGKPDSKNPDLESIIQSAWKRVKKPDGEERTAADPQFGRTLVGNPEESGLSDTQSPLDLGNMMADMARLMKEYN